MEEGTQMVTDSSSADVNILEVDAKTQELIVEYMLQYWKRSLTKRRKIDEGRRAVGIQKKIGHRKKRKTKKMPVSDLDPIHVYGLVQIP